MGVVVVRVVGHRVRHRRRRGRPRFTGEKPFGELELHEFERCWRVNAAGHFNVAKAARAYLAAERRGRIVNSTSGAGIYGLAPFVAYAAAKGAINGMTQALALEGEPFGIAVNAISPGARTRMTVDAPPGPGPGGPIGGSPR
jgi:NAD(P)-dependent dehydrogenase (short-subunit alcohol dehydrogenase family)